ncbi:MAG: hypothetical protein NT080_01325 [Spirochaetes bacterium]|nr:hypothetical protein [Spirochaetota bacterium]
MAAYLEREALMRDEAGLDALWDDLYGFMSYLGRTGEVRRPNSIPFWEYSIFLEWAEGHLMFGDRFDLNLANANRSLRNIKAYFEYLDAGTVIPGTAQVDRAIKEICKKKKLDLIHDIPYGGTESWTELWIKGEPVSFDMADYWLLALLERKYSGDWKALHDAAPQHRKADKVNTLRIKLAKAGRTGLKDLAFDDLHAYEVARAEAWFSGRGQYA